MLTVNTGSSSLRLAKYTLDTPPFCIAETHFSAPPSANPDVLLSFLRERAPGMPDIVMHRVVHGGQSLGDPCLIDESVEAEIHRLSALAPLHNDLALAWIRAAREAFGPECLQAAIFDTGFYRGLSAEVATYPLPRKLSEQFLIRRYGFHGLAHQSMLNQWHETPRGVGNRRVISLQLGAGCSITATDHGSPVETSMGFSPLEGLMMATRCGDLDPAIVLYLIEQAGFSAAELGNLLNESSGLHGVSGETGDMRLLLESPTADAAMAVNMFCHRVRKYLGAYLAVLGGADAVLFGGGIGEHAPEIRSQVLSHFEWSGIVLDASRNMGISPGAGGPIHADSSTVEVWVFPSDEGRVMADAATDLLARQPAATQTTDLEKQQ